MKVLVSALLIGLSLISAQDKKYKVVAYFSGDSTQLYSYKLDKITHLIYSFGHLKDGHLVVDSPKDEATLRAFAGIKKQYPKLKLMIALGGWGGCEFCSQTFGDKRLTDTFVSSVAQFLDAYKLDGIDIDWEYPTVEGFPGHRYGPKDKKNFSRLFKKMRAKLGDDAVITFAAGGFSKYLQDAVDWNVLLKYVDFINLMTYDLVGGYATRSGHHTPLYATYKGEESCDNAIDFFERVQVPLSKVVLGSAFYYREFSGVDSIANGVYRPAKFLAFVPYKEHLEKHGPDFVYYWDEKAQAPYWYNAESQVFVTGDDKRSIEAKCRYIERKKLGGLMFWELSYDTLTDGLYTTIQLD